MRKEIKTTLAICQRIILLCVICMILPTGLVAQKNETIYPNTSTDSIAMRASIYFSPNGGEWIEKNEYNDALARRVDHWYIGIGGGVSFGRSTFCSFAMDGTRPGINVGVLGGYKINKLLSAELSFDYTRMDLRTYDCCQLLWLAADGNRYAAPVAGIKNYAYNDLRSVTNLFGLGAHLNIDLVSLWNENSRWSALVSPAIYGIYSSADLKQLSTGANATDATSYHFGLGADLGVGYQFTDCFGLRLTTGINYLTGKGIGGLPQEEHKANYVWNASLKLIFKL